MSMSAASRQKKTVQGGTASKRSQYQSVSKGSRFGRSTISSRTNVMSSASKRSVLGQGDKATNKPPVQVVDELGQDVTPQPLLHIDQTLKKQPSNIIGDSSAGTPTDFSLSIYNTGTVTQSTFGGGPFSRSVFSQSQADNQGEFLTTTEAAPEAGGGSGWTALKPKKDDTKDAISEEGLMQVVDIVLKETPTMWLLDLSGVCIANDSEEAVTVKENNTRYEELMKNRVGNDRYIERSMNTFNEPPKYKNIQTINVTYTDVGVMATNWDMFDTFEAIEKAEREAENGEEDEEGTISRPASKTALSRETTDQTTIDGMPINPADELDDAQGQTIAEGTVTIMSSVAGSSVFGFGFGGRETPQVKIEPVDTQAEMDELILKSDSLKRDLFIMERVVNLNTYQPKQALYRDLCIICDIDKEPADTPAQINVTDMGPNLDRLWSYGCSLTKGRNVSCLAWNKDNHDLFAVGYGQFEFSNQKPGMVCCWSLKNPEYPERVYLMNEGVTSLGFSNRFSNLLAVGMYDGGVAIYNVRSSSDEAVLDNFETPGKHTSPVWQLQWIEKDRGSDEETVEVLISGSTDGRITQWSIRKGFESYDLMRLKRLPTKMQGKGKEKKGEAFISRYAGGFCFDFHKGDTDIYLVGTEEGFIHKCSCSYNEQFLDTFVGHNNPVYRINWSPYVPDLFLSSSADWSIRLWHQERAKPILNFFSSTKSVYDVLWSPNSSTVFACVNEGAVEIWDLSISTLDPVITNKPISEAKLTSVSFAHNSESIIVGDSEGMVTVYQLRCMPRVPYDQAGKLNNIIKASLASQLQAKTDKENKDNKDAEFFD